MGNGREWCEIRKKGYEGDRKNEYEDGVKGVGMWENWRGERRKGGEEERVGRVDEG